MMKRVPRRGLAYETYEEASKYYTPEERWTVFDGTKERFNITHECIDRHVGKGVAIRVKLSDGSSEQYTFDELSRYSSQFANFIEGLGVGKGERVAILLDPSLEFYVSLFGTLKRGAVAVVCSTLFGPEAIEYRLRHSQSRVLVAPRERLREVDVSSVGHVIAAEDIANSIARESDRYEPSTSADDLAVIQYTSGTTGPPKAIPYMQKALANLAPTARFGWGIKEGDRFFCTSSPAWGHGLWAGTFAPLIFGVPTGTRSGKFDPELTLEALEEFNVNNATAVSTAWRKIVATGKVKDYRLSIEKLTYTGEPIDLDTFYELKEAFKVDPCSEYGTTEFGTICIDYTGFKDWKVKPASLGKPMLGVEVAIVDEEGRPLPPGAVGDIAVRKRGQWVRVGDAGMMDEDGYFWYKGRSDDVIKSSGYRIGPGEVEQVLNRHEAVLESAVIGVPDRERGQVVKAFIVLKPGYEPSDSLLRSIQEYAKSRLSRYAYPRLIEFVSELPKTLDGKIKRKELRLRELSRLGQGAA
jgi:acetyl-CoA synthetase